MRVAGKVKSSAALAVVVELAYQVFKTHKSEVVLSNAMLRSVGISHKAKLRALRQLEAAGWCGRLESAKSPRDGSWRIGPWHRHMWVYSLLSILSCTSQVYIHDPMVIADTRSERRFMPLAD